ncbi:MAG TPA: DUF4012 domain-containing protein [Actinomycetota bacterium]|nr:DUF4012 domain-containing protein [Actinomycetota bacterium]
MSTDQDLELEHRPGRRKDAGGIGSGRARHRARPRWGLAALVAVGALLLVAVISMVPALAARTALAAGRDSLIDARTATLRGDVPRAEEAFREARSDFERALSHVTNPFLRVMGVLPLIGRSVDTSTEIARAGDLTARAGEILTGAVEELPRGPEALAPRRGTIPLDPIRRLATPLARSSALLTQAHETVVRAPRGLVLAPIVAARDEMEFFLADARRAARTAALLAQRLPSFLGGEGTRRYFVGAQNPAENRGTGGFIGAYSILTVRDGRLELSDFQTPTRLPRYGDVDRVEPPNPDYALRYDQFSSRVFWPHINMTPDFPSAAVAIERLYEEGTGERLDGTILTDPFALAGLLRVIGQVEVPVSGERVDGSDVVPYVTNEAYADLPEGDRKHLLGETAQIVLDRFLDGRFRTDLARAGRAMVKTAADGHLLLHSAHPEEQAAFEDIGVHGPLGGGPGDYLHVVGANVSGNKTDYYVERTIEYEVHLGAEGTALGRTEVTLENSSPTSGMPRYVIGPYDERFRAGENITYLSTYCARSCLLDRFARDGRPDAIAPGTELGYPAYSTDVRIRSGQSETVAYEWTLDRVWHGDVGRGTYRLTFRNQTTIQPTHLEVRIHVPAGMEVVEATPGVRVGDDGAVWEGEPEDLLTLKISFERPLLSRVWQRIADFLGRPVF